jgi:hypothetical protein
MKIPPSPKARQIKKQTLIYTKKGTDIFKVVPHPKSGFTRWL